MYQENLLMKRKILKGMIMFDKNLYYQYEKQNTNLHFVREYKFKRDKTNTENRLK